MTVLSDREIHRYCLKGMVDPFIPSNVQPASIDLILGNDFISFDPTDIDPIDMNDVKNSGRKIIDLRDGFMLMPRQFVLAVTKEFLSIPPTLMARIEGKSSIGRLGLLVHVTAGFIDPGFRGPLTLELYNLRQVPIILRPGKPICQVSFHQMNSVPTKPYSGRYQDATGVEASLYGKTRDD